MIGDSVPPKAATALATLARTEGADGATSWTLSLHTGEQVTSYEVGMERLTDWSGPCSNEIAYRCTTARDGPAILAGDLEWVTIKGRGEFTVRRVHHMPDGRWRIELHRPPADDG